MNVGVMVVVEVLCFSQYHDHHCLSPLSARPRLHAFSLESYSVARACHALQGHARRLQGEWRTAHCALSDLSTCMQCQYRAAHFVFVVYCICKHGCHAPFGAHTHQPRRRPLCSLNGAVHILVRTVQVVTPPWHAALAWHRLAVTCTVSRAVSISCNCRTAISGRHGEKEAGQWWRWARC